MENPLATHLVFALCGLAALVGLFFQLRSRRRLRAAATCHAVATVLNIRGNNKYRPTYAFLVDELPMVVHSTLSTSPALFRDGTVVDLYYVPDDPERFYVPRERKISYMLSVLLLLFAVGLLYIGISGLLSM